MVRLNGNTDALIPIKRGREMKAAVPSAHYAELKGADYMPTKVGGGGLEIFME